MSTFFLGLIFSSVLANQPPPAPYDPMADLKQRVERCWANGDGSTAIWWGWNGKDATALGLQPFDECVFYHGRLVAAACTEGAVCRKFKAFLFGIRL